MGASHLVRQHAVILLTDALTTFNDAETLAAFALLLLCFVISVAAGAGALPSV
ncbi:MAG TPA: hypothetical protein VMU34_05985 [Mycobacterium sp.]|nr:hypothetical protein [Mycobacterium sp.]